MPAKIPFPFIEIHLKGGRLDRSVLAFADTGHDGDIVLPIGEREKFSENDGIARVTLADGKTSWYEFFYVVVSIAHREFVVEAVCMGNEYIIGTKILNHFRVCFDHGRKIEIENPSGIEN